MDLGLKGKRALVFASTSGIGKAIATSLASEGARVVVCSRHVTAVAATVAEIVRQTKAEVHGFVCNLAQRASVDHLVDRTIGALGGVDILVNNCGGPPSIPTVEASSEILKQWFDTMVVSIIHATHRLIPAMQARRWGRVLTVTSVSGVTPVPYMLLSNANRTFLHAWNKTLTHEVAADGVTCNVLVTGRFQTPRVVERDIEEARRRGTTPEAIAATAAEAIPAGRYGRVEEFGDVAAFMASEQASYINGALIRIDGGIVRSL